MKTLKLPDQKTAHKILNRASAIAKEKGGSLASAVVIAQNEADAGPPDDDGSAAAQTNADAIAWIQKRAAEMHAATPNLSLATCLGMAQFEYNNQKWNLGL